MAYISNERFTLQRQQLTSALRKKGITDERVLAIINEVPRELFMSDKLQEKAYADHAFPIGAGQTISQPYTVAYQTQLLDVQATDKVLEIGTGSAYQTVILASLAAEVYTVERQQALYERNQQLAYLQSFTNIHRYFGDGFDGLPQHAPFDKILVTAAAPFLPPKLFDQLKTGGCMVVPLADKDAQKMTRITKLTNDTYDEETFGYFSFVPMLKGTQRR